MWRYALEEIDPMAMPVPAESTANLGSAATKVIDQASMLLSNLRTTKP